MTTLKFSMLKLFLLKFMYTAPEICIKLSQRWRTNLKLPRRKMNKDLKMHLNLLKLRTKATKIAAD